MALAFTVDSLDAVPESFHSLYVERDGLYVLDINGDLPSPDVSNLKKALDSERKRSSDAERAKRSTEAKLASYDGIDVNKYRELLTKAEKDEEERLIAEGKKDELFNAKLDSVNNEWKKQVLDKESLIDANSKRIEQLRSKALSDQIRSGINGVFHSYANDDAVMAAMNLFKFDDNDNVVMLDKDGGYITGDDLIKKWATSSELKETKPHWFAGMPGGTGTDPSKQKLGSKTITRDSFMALTPIEQAKIMREKVIRVIDK